MLMYPLQHTNSCHQFQGKGLLRYVVLNNILNRCFIFIDCHKNVIFLQINKDVQFIITFLVQTEICQQNVPN